MEREQRAPGAWYRNTSNNTKARRFQREERKEYRRKKREKRRKETERKEGCLGGSCGYMSDS